MGISRELIDQLGHLLRPIGTRVANMIARGVIQRVDDSTRMQLVQIGVQHGETVEGEKGAEHFHPYGLTSVPLTDAESVVIFPDGDRSHPLVIVTSDRRYRPTDGDPGEVGLHNHIEGCRVKLLDSGDIEIQPAPGRQVFIREEGGHAEPLVRRSEFLSHGHVIVATAAVSPCAGPVTGAAPPGSSVAFPGTAKLEAE